MSTKRQTPRQTKQTSFPILLTAVRRIVARGNHLGPRQAERLLLKTATGGVPPSRPSHGRSRAASGPAMKD